MIDLSMVFNSIRKRKLGNFVTIIQFVIAFFALVISIGLVMDIVNKLYISRKMVSSNSYILQDNGDNILAKKEFYNALKSKKNIDSYGFYFYQRESINYLNISNGLLNMFNFKVKTGRDLNIQDFKKSREIPVLITPDLKENYPINSTIKRKYLDQVISYKVVGIVDDSFKFWYKSDKLIQTPKNTIICPSKLDDYNINTAHIIITLKNTNKIKDLENSFKSIINNATEDSHQSDDTNSTQHLIVNLRKYMFSVIHEKIQTVIYTIFFSITIVILSITGLVINLNLLLIKRLNEFGIRISLGATIKDISKLISAELFIDFIIAYIISIIPAILTNVYLPKSGGILINLWSLLIVFVIILLFTFLIFKNIVRMLKKYQPIKLIRGA